MKLLDWITDHPNVLIGVLFAGYVTVIYAAMRLFLTVTEQLP